MRELLGILLAAILVVGGGLTAFDAYTSGQQANNVDQMRQAILTYKVKMVPHYQRVVGKYGASAFSATTMIQLGLVPASEIASATALADAVGGTEALTGNNNSFYVDADGWSPPECSLILSTFTSGMGIISIRTASSLAGLPASSPMTLGAIPDGTMATACSASSNAIRFEIQ